MMRRILTTLVAIVMGVVFYGALPSARRPAEAAVVVNCTSSVFRAVAYDPGRSVLTLRFTNGYEYEYYDVPRGCAQAMLQSSVKGRFFNRNIRGQYACSRMNHAMDEAGR